VTALSALHTVDYVARLRVFNILKLSCTSEDTRVARLVDGCTLLEDEDEEGLLSPNCRNTMPHYGKCTRTYEINLRTTRCTWTRVSRNMQRPQQLQQLKLSKAFKSNEDKKKVPRMQHIIRHITVCT